VKINEVKMDQKGKGKQNAKIVVHVVICNLGLFACLMSRTVSAK